MRLDQIPDPVQRERQLDYNRAIAQKIRNRLQQLENANDNDKKRWVWELLQNAKDTVKDRKVNIEIVVNEDYIEFRHNGGYFNARNITNLIHQISSKEGLEGSIGRFGTGFLTTHTLSRLIEVEGIFVVSDEFYTFELRLDRQKTTEKDLVKGIEEAWNSFKSNKVEEPKNQVWSVFRYLNPDISLATETLKDFETYIHFNLAFVQGLGNITINNQIENRTTTFKLTKEPQKLDRNLYIFSFQKEEEEINVLLAKNEDLSIAIEIEKLENSYAFKPIKQNVPRIFCAFPLIGTETFYFPFVVNSDKFVPKTERDKLYLKGNTKDTDKNKTLLLQAVDLYKKVIRFASENKWKDFYVVADAKLPKQDEDLDISWYQNNIQNNIRRFLLPIPIIETEKGDLISITDNSGRKAITFFPFDAEVEIREKIWQFSFDLYPNNIPKKKDVHFWYDLLWHNCYRQTLSALAEKHIAVLKTIENLSKKLKRNLEDTYIWLNELCLFFEKEKSILLSIYTILPNQYGIFKLKMELYEDKNIPNELKEILFQLNTDVDWKKELLHKTIQIKMNSFRTVYAISEAINAIIRKNDKDFSNEKMSKTIGKLISYTNNKQSDKQQKIWEFSRAFYYDKIPNTLQKLENTIQFDWTDSLKWQINKLVIDISELKYVESLEEQLHGTAHVIEWLRELIDFLQKETEYKFLLDDDENPILPNQNAWFYPKSQLFLDDGTIDNALKDVLRPLKPEWIDELLDTNIYLELPDNRVRSFVDIATEIDGTFKNYPTAERETQAFRDAFNHLYAWYQEQEEEKVKKYFDWISRNIAPLFVSLIGSKEERQDILNIATSGKSHIFSAIANNEAIKDEDLNYFKDNFEKFRQLKALEESGKTVSKKIALDEKLAEINAKTGKSFTSFEELTKELEKEKDNEKVDFIIKSTSNSKYVDMAAIKKSNENAKEAIQEKLNQNSAYDVTHWEEKKGSNTIIEKVKKNGIEIILITKGADNDIVYLTQKEKDTLKDNGTFAELWVHSNKKVFEINLGKVFEKWNAKYIRANMFDFQ